MRSMASGASYHRAYTKTMQQAFLEAHQLAFACVGGVFRPLRYDNLKSAIKRILRGHRREETTRFITFRSHRVSRVSFATLPAATRRAASRVKEAISGATTGCRYRKPAAWMS